MSPRLHTLLMTTTALLALAPRPGVAGPDGATVVGGAATVAGAGTGNVTVNQASERAIVNWNTFNIGAGETTRFVQPNTSSVVLNRVTGGLGPSTIDGTLTANGKVFLINRDGMLFGPNAVVNTAGFVATTHDIKNDDFMAGRYNFNISGRPDASIVNQGHITATSGGFAALVAPGVRNTGTITATLGTVSLASGNMFTLDLYGDKLIQLGVGDEIAAQVRDVATGQPLKSLVSNEGKLRANGGRVELTAAAARRVVDSVINNKGVIEANSIGTRNGMIVLGAATGRSKPAGATKQTVRIGGTLSASGRKKGTSGGKIVVTGENIEVANAKINASGKAGGGKVLIGGDWAGGNPTLGLVNNQSARLESYSIATATTVSVDSASTINASARNSGDGGKVVLWSDVQTTFAGTIFARGGASGSNGGFVEVSSHGVLDFSGAVDTRAPRGMTGTLLLDPGNVTIVATGPDTTTAGSGSFTGSNTSDTTIKASTIVQALNSSNVIVQTGTVAGFNDGDINVNTTVAWNSGNSLTLSAYHDIVVQDRVTIASLGGGNIVLRADSTGTGNGAVSFGLDQTGHVGVSGGGAVSIYYNPIGAPTKYDGPTDFSQNVTGPFTGYMLVNNAGDLSLIGIHPPSTLAGTFALGRNIDAKTLTASIPGTFTGLLDGNGGLGVNYAIDHLSVGLFSTIGGTATVRNLNLTNVAINVPSGGPIGALAGTNNGAITKVAVAGSVSGGTVSLVGGLVGENSGTITNSSITAIVSGGQGASVGGLVGSVKHGGSVSNSFASGTVMGNNAVAVGGLAGTNDGTITQSQAAGAVSGSGVDVFTGGLVGENFGTITNSSASGAVSGGLAAGGLVGLNVIGTITDSSAGGPVSSNVADPDTFFGGLGGLVGVNVTGTITNSHATGNVTGGTHSYAGGLIGSNFDGVITNSYATGNVSAGPGSILGGFVAFNFDDFIGLGLPQTFSGSHATGNVIGSADSIAGGFFGANLFGTIDNSFATGAVSGGTGGTVGGFGGLNIGTVKIAYASGPASGGANSFVGGFLGVNFTAVDPTISFVTGAVTQSFALGAATGGTNSFVAGFAAINVGSLDQTYAGGLVTGGPGSTTGGLVASNSFNYPLLPSIAVLDPPGIVTNSYWDLQTTGQTTSAGGAPVNTAQLAPGLPLGFNPAVWGTIAGQYPYLIPLGPSGTTPGLPVLPPMTTLPVLPGQPIPPAVLLQQVIQEFRPLTTFAAVTAGEVVNTQAFTAPLQQPSGQSGPSGGGDGTGPTGAVTPSAPEPIRLNVGEGRYFYLPPVGETRLVANEVVLQLPCNPGPAFDTVTSQLGLSVINSQCMGETAVYQVQLSSGQTVASTIRALAAYQLVAAAQANYIYALAQEGTAAPQGDASQYILDKLKLTDIHRTLKGTNVSIGVIDSEIDAKHPDLEGIIVDRFDAVGDEDKPHPHGTGMAGAIGSHRRLMGVAPSARLYAIRAFSAKTANAESTTFNILKGLDWAVTQQVQIVNMSFAGPKDPSLERALKAAHDKGTVLVAAAGNGGPKSPPLYPGADPNVIAVTATDIDDKLFAGANRGRYVAISAPGVDILVPAPEATYQMTTGTSVATAHISGIVALLLERNPRLKPDEIRKILTASAKRLGPNNEFGAGLVDPTKALELAAPRSAAAPAPVAR